MEEVFIYVFFGLFTTATVIGCSLTYAAWRGGVFHRLLQNQEVHSRRGWAYQQVVDLYSRHFSDNRDVHLVLRRMSHDAKKLAKGHDIKVIKNGVGYTRREVLEANGKFNYLDECAIPERCMTRDELISVAQTLASSFKNETSGTVFEFTDKDLVRFLNSLSIGDNIVRE